MIKRAMNFFRNLNTLKYFIEGNLRHVYGRFGNSLYKYNWGANDFSNLCTVTYNRSTDFQEAIDLFSRGCADLPICLRVNDKDNMDIPKEILDFLGNVSKEQLMWREFIKNCFISFFVGGELFLLKDTEKKKVIMARPDELTNIKVVDGVPWEYTVSQGFFDRTKLIGYDSKEYKFESVFKDGLWRSKISHFYNRNPVFTDRGLSIVVSLINDIEILFKGRTWNRSLLENEGRPSGVFFYPPNTAQGKLPNMQMKGRAKAEEEIRGFFGGDVNAGKALFLKGGLQFKEITFKMTDIDFQNGLKFSRESIANRLGIPLQLFGSESSSTYNNMREARFGFYENTCVPFMNTFLNFFSLHVLMDFFPGQIDNNRILAVDRKRLFKKSPVFLERISQLQAQHFLTPNEKRELLDLPPLDDENMDTPMIPSNLVPIEDAGLVEESQGDDGFGGEKDDDKDDKEDKKEPKKQPKKGDKK